jgi:hypothetical protein
VAGWSAVVLAAAALRSRRALGAARAHPALAAPALTAGIAALALAAAYGASNEQRDEHRFEFAAVRRLDAGLTALPRGSVVKLVAHLDGVLTPLRPELTYALRRRGVRALGTGAYLRLGHWYELAGRPYEHVLLLYDGAPPHIPGGREIARARLRVRGRTWRLGLVEGPAPADRRPASRDAERTA